MISVFCSCILLLLFVSATSSVEIHENLAYQNPIKGFDFGLDISKPSLRRRLESSEIDCNPQQCFSFHSVASGDATDTSVILWTKLIPNPNMPDCSRCILTAYFKIGNKQGAVTTYDAINFIIKLDVFDLEPNSDYTYRFRLSPFRNDDSSTNRPRQRGRMVQISGRTKTLPSPGTPVLAVRFAQVSCQFMEAGYYLAYRDIASDDSIDFVLHLGDTIYEHGDRSFPWENGQSLPAADRRAQPAHQCRTLEDYRIRHQQYKSDEHSKAAFAAKPFYFVWDDHEVDDGSYMNGSNDETNNTIVAWPQRKRNAIQAFFEWTAVRQLDLSDMFKQYRAIRYGELLHINLLETRLSGKTKPTVSLTESLLADPETHKMIGDDQMSWLLDSTAMNFPQWTAVGSAVSVADILPVLATDASWNAGDLRDFWVGYYKQRTFMLTELSYAVPQNLMFLSGDTHAFGINRVAQYFDYPAYQAERLSTPPNVPLFGAGERFAGPIVGIEISSGSISSPGAEMSMDSATLAGFLGLLNAEFSFVVPRLKIGVRGYTVNHVQDGLWTMVQYGYSTIQDLNATKFVDHTACWADGSREFLDESLCVP